MIAALETSNWINLGICGATVSVAVTTVLAGVLAWRATRKSAKEARESQEQANAAAKRSADAAEQVVGIERERDAEAAERAKTGELAARFATTVHFEATNRPATKTNYLIIANQGAGQARRVQVWVDGKDIQELLRRKLRDLTIGWDSDYPILWPGNNRQPPFRVSLSWEDDSGNPGTWEGDVNAKFET